MAHLKKSIVELKAGRNCFPQSFVIASANVGDNPNYHAFWKGQKIRHAVQTLLEMTGIDLSNGAGIAELLHLKEHFWEYKIFVYHGLSCEDIMFEGQVDSSKRINLLYEDVERHYHLITNPTGTMARKYVFKACNKACRRDVTHVCDQTCKDCLVSPPCAFSHVCFPCAQCNRHFRSRTCFAKLKQSTATNKSLCERKRCCATCGWVVTNEKHECNKR